MPGSELGVELLVLVSVFGLWCFDNWSAAMESVRNWIPDASQMLQSLPTISLSKSP
jgi:hypothetical protein